MKKLSEEHKRKLSEVHKYNWKMGKEKINSGCFKKGMKKSKLAYTWKSEQIQNKKAYRKGLTKENDKSILNQSINVSKTLKKLYKEGKIKPNPYFTHKGRPHSEETKQKLAKYNKEKSSNWQGGKSFEPYGIEFNKSLKEKIRKKYNYRCQQCFRHQNELRTKTNRHRKLCIHHIDFNKQNNQENNLIPLCLNCHMQTNFNRKDWEAYFKKC